jgi:hypothetical protein
MARPDNLAEALVLGSGANDRKVFHFGGNDHAGSLHRHMADWEFK